ncbi:MAG: hypothetical protein OSB14_05365, partial [Planctomycetota bacterium]|nr:hypothetical protein [Planctomycetota bacterium]
QADTRAVGLAGEEEATQRSLLTTFPMEKLRRSPPEIRQMIRRVPNALNKPPFVQTIHLDPIQAGGDVKGLHRYLFIQSGINAQDMLR